VTDYEEMQYQAAKRFLQTALVVDDRMSTEPEDKGEAPQGGLVAPGTPLVGREAEQSVAETSGADGVTVGDTTAGSHIDGDDVDDASSVVHVKPLADRFADLRLTCGVLKPSPNEPPTDVTQRIVRAASGVDIVVLDWMLDPATEFTAEQAVKDVVAQDEYGRRLIAIYTTQRDLEGIAQSLEEAITRATRIDDELALQAGGTRILIFHKGGPQLDEKWMAYKRDESELPETLVRAFAKLSSGLVPAVALNSLAATRENAHRLLERLDQGLDLGYLGHLLRLAYREEGEQHLLDAISGELRAVIEDDTATRATASAGFDAWLAHHNEQLHVPAEALARLGEAMTDKKLLKAWAKKEIAGTFSEENVTELLVPVDEAVEARRSDARFAHLMAMRQPYARPEPELHLGTIVRERDLPSNYWVCIQPVCDSVRLDADPPTAFLMLPLEPVDHAAKGVKAAFVVRSDGGEWIHLWPWDRSSDIELMRMRPNHNGAVRFLASETDGTLSGPKTVTTEEDITLIWIAQLKTAHALRVVHQYGTQLSRVGLDESEWIRLRGREGTRPERRPRVPVSDRRGQTPADEGVPGDGADGSEAASASESGTSGAAATT
jgi:hypothetical protein